MACRLHPRQADAIGTVTRRNRGTPGGSGSILIWALFAIVSHTISQIWPVF